jgi:DNA polymerase III delta prime subunit
MTANSPPPTVSQVVIGNDNILVAGSGNIIQKNIIKGGTPAQIANRQRMLQLVRNNWIEGVLEQSLYHEVLINLGMETHKDAVEQRPWDVVLQMPKQPDCTLPPGTKMLDVFKQADYSLLILGEPGSGKTTMLLELARQAIDQAEKDPIQSIPVVFHLSTWDDPNRSIANWLVDEFSKNYRVNKKITLPWLENDELMLLLDGLDEVKVEHQEACVQAINAFRQQHTIPIAVCSRRANYEKLGTRFKFDGAILLQPLSPNQIDQYFEDIGVGRDALYQVVWPDEQLRELAQTPLMLSIITLAYQEMPTEKLSQTGSIEERGIHLYNTYIARMFELIGRKKDERYSKEQTIRWLAWLAAKMVKHGQIVFYIENLQPDWLANSKEIKQQKSILDLPLMLVGGLIAGLGGWLVAGPIVGLLSGLMFGVGGGLALGEFIMSRNFIEPTDRLRLLRRREVVRELIAGLGAGLLFGLIVGLAGGLATVLGGKSIGGLVGRLVTGLGGGLVGWLVGGLLAGLVGGLLLGLYDGLVAGLDSSTIETRNVPGQGLRSSTINMLIAGLLTGLIVGLLVGLFYGLIFGLGGGLVFGLVSGLVFGLVFGMTYGGTFLIQHFSLRWLLFRFKRIPWNYIRFLDYATDHIFLRRVGGGYIFIHRTLMEHFAAMAEARQPIFAA